METHDDDVRLRYAESCGLVKEGARVAAVERRVVERRLVERLQRQTRTTASVTGNGRFGASAVEIVQQ